MSMHLNVYLGPYLEIRMDSVFIEHQETVCPNNPINHKINPNGDFCHHCGEKLTTISVKEETRSDKFDKVKDFLRCIPDEENCFTLYRFIENFDHEDYKYITFEVPYNYEEIDITPQEIQHAIEIFQNREHVQEAIKLADQYDVKFGLIVWFV